MQSGQGLVLPGLKEPEHKVYVGTAGWLYKDWAGIVYPKNPHSHIDDFANTDGLEKSSGHFDPLHYISHIFDTIEINSTFYKIPEPHIAKNWCERVAHKKEFFFTVKLWKEFTHGRTDFHRKEAAAFKEMLDVLAEEKRLGCLLVQFPWSLYFNQNNLNWLKMIIADFSDYKIAVEVRNKEWLNERFIDFLKENNAAFCNIDLPDSSNQQIPPTSIITADFSYVRLHGRNHENWFKEGASVEQRYDYLYSPEELKPWIERVKVLKAGTKETFFITNNHYHGQAVCNALEVKAIIEQKKQNIPEQLLEHYPLLKHYALPIEHKEQMDLF